MYFGLNSPLRHHRNPWSERFRRGGWGFVASRSKWRRPVSWGFVGCWRGGPAGFRLPRGGCEVPGQRRCAVGGVSFANGFANGGVWLSVRDPLGHGLRGPPLAEQAFRGGEYRALGLGRYRLVAPSKLCRELIGRYRGLAGPTRGGRLGAVWVPMRFVIVPRCGRVVSARTLGGPLAVGGNLRTSHSSSNHPFA